MNKMLRIVGDACLTPLTVALSAPFALYSSVKDFMFYRVASQSIHRQLKSSKRAVLDRGLFLDLFGYSETCYYFRDNSPLVKKLRKRGFFVCDDYDGNIYVTAKNEVYHVG